MKRIFKCCECGMEYEVEADHFIPGVSGTVVTSDGTVHTYVDPTDEGLCQVCLYLELVSSGLPMLVKTSIVKEKQV